MNDTKAKPTPLQHQEKLTLGTGPESVDSLQIKQICKPRTPTDMAATESVVLCVVVYIKI